MSDHRWIRVLGCLFFAIGAQVSMAQDKDEVMAVNAAFYEAFSKQDLSAMKQIWAEGPSVRMIGPSAKSIVEGSSDVGDGWKNVFDRFQEISISMSNPQVRAGSQVAWVVGLETVEAVRTSGEEVRMSVMGTNVFEKIGGRWFMVHHHASRPAK